MPNPVDRLGWIPELRLAQLLGVPRTSLRTWTEKGLVTLPKDGSYRFRQVVEALLASAIRAHLSLAVSQKVLAKMRQQGTTLDEAVLAASRVDELDRFDVVIDLDNSSVTFCWDDAALIAAVSDDSEARRVVVHPLARRIVRVVDGFDNMAVLTQVPSSPRRGRVSTSSSKGTVSPIRRGA